MNLTERRAAVVESLSTTLPSKKWFPSIPAGVREGSGWLVLTGVSSEAMPFGLLAASFNVVLALGDDVAYATEQMDSLIVPLHDACVAAGGWGVTASPDSVTVDGATLYVLTATLQTEVEAS